MRMAGVALCLALAGAPGPLLAAPDAAAAARVAKAATDGFIRPAYAAFRQQSAELAGSVETLCTAPSLESLEAAQEGFAKAALSFARAEIVSFGPLSRENRRERLLFWPDRKGVGLRQVQAILAAKDPADAIDLQSKSVAVQGFPALEFTLFGSGSEALADGREGFRCAYAQAVSRNIARISADLDREWADPGGFAARWASPGPDNPEYRDAGEALAEATDALLHGLELVRDVRMAFLGETPTADRPKQALYWRSLLTFDANAATLQGLGDFLATSGLTDLAPADLAWIGPSAAFEFANATTATVASSGSPVEAVLADPKRRSRLVYAKLVTASVSEIVGRHLTRALGLTAGFSSLDGD